VKTALLDLNVLAALLWPAHEHHEVAHRWFADGVEASWATCSLTQIGFVRVLSNPAFSRDALSPTEATALLASNLRHRGHQFWNDSLQLPAALRAVEAKLQGHRQVTDTYLLALAHRNKGFLATFDRGAGTLAGDRLAGALQVIPTR
jgi:toxin-antitoxin system PIN domain toxin